MAFRIRHKRCDEKRPACSQCQGTGRNCDFQQSLNPSRPLIYPGTLKVWSLSGQLWSMPRLYLIDVWYFDYFRVVCAKQLSVSLGTDLWESVVLPAALAEPCIMHGVLALSALSKDMVPSRLSRGLMSLAGHSASYPLRRYNQAIRELNARLGTSRSSQELALIGSLIFIAVESYLDRDDIAQMHLQGALTMLRDFKRCIPPGAEFLKMIAPCFDSLAATSQVSSKRLSSLIRLIPTPFQTLRDVSAFKNISEARDSLNSITATIHSLHQRGPAETLPSPQSYQSPLLADDISVLSRRLDLWNTHFAALKANSTADVETSTCVHLLLIHHEIAKLHLSREPENRIHVHQFLYIVELSTKILRAEEGSRAITTQPKPGHSLDTAIIQPLFYTACTCKNGIVRRRAINLIESANVVFVYDTQLLARAAKWVVAMEEKIDPESGQSNISVKEEDMLYDVKLEVGSEPGRWDITAWRRANGFWSKVSSYIPRYASVSSQKD
ncbi:hypothetical protein F5Y03DRAFT_356335 [Xylaria venustula]|nr:hypothetical protein F5Y03DRAFT_356335 [Xylaria venustula]